MKPSKNLCIISCFILLISLLFSCSKENDGVIRKPVRFVTEKDTFKTDVIWYADTIYVIKKSPEILGKLTIRPGTIIKLETATGLIGSLIFAIGTKEQPIIFTSIYDDEHGGDIDGDNGAIKPQVGDWLCIGSPTMSLQVRYEYCEFYYGGSVIALTQLSQKIENCIFAHCNGFMGMGYSCTLLALSMEPTTATISKNLFYDNVQPLIIYPGTSIDSTNTFSYNGTGNKQNGIFIYKKEITLKAQLNWQENEVPFVVQKNITIEDGGHLEFINGTVIKFMPGIQITKAIIGSGSSLNGSGKNVIFTSIKDDVHGGDTNGDGNGSTAHNGDWEGIYGGLIIGWWTGSNILYDNH